MSASIESLVNREYQHGWVTDIESDTVPPGLSEDVVRLISQKKKEPEWLLEWRLKAYRRWLTMKEPSWANVKYPPIDYQGASYYSAPKSVKPLQSLDEVDPVAGADGYVITIKAVTGDRVVWESAPMATTETKLPATVALEPEVHTWSVTARKGTEVLATSPTLKFTITP